MKRKKTVRALLIFSALIEKSDQYAVFNLRVITVTDRIYLKTPKYSCDFQGIIFHRSKTT
jgi:hypothetical protein